MNEKNFILQGLELESAKKFIAEQMKKDSTMPTAGERWKYSFTPCGLGTIVSIEDNASGDIKDITDWSLF